MPAKSKSQQRFFGMVSQCQKTGKCASDSVRKAADSISKKDATDFAETKHKGLPNRVAKEGYTIKELVGGMSFTSFLLTEAAPGMDTSTVRGYIRSLPTYQELVADKQTKPQVLKLAKSLVDEFGDGPLDDNTKDYIFDEIDQLSQDAYKGRTNVGDWAGEDEWKRKRQEEKDIASAADKWEKATGMDAETGRELPTKRRSGGARVGMSYNADKKAAQAQSDLAAFADAPAPEQADRLAAAKTQAQGVGGPAVARGSKSSAARAIFDEMFGQARPSEIINRMMSEVGMSKPHATTYYYNFKKRAQQA